MDIWEFYASVEQLIDELRERGARDDASEVERALRSGATSGEILGDVMNTLTSVSVRHPELASRADGLALWARQALNPTG